MLRLAILGTLGYLGYKYLGSDQTQKRAERQPAIAGGPLSSQARLQGNPDQPPLLNPLSEPTPA